VNIQVADLRVGDVVTGAIDKRVDRIERSQSGTYEITCRNDRGVPTYHFFRGDMTIAIRDRAEK
jgi:hypothetical protein